MAIEKQMYGMTILGWEQLCYLHKPIFLLANINYKENLLEVFTGL